MYIDEAYAILKTTQPTLDELLQAHEVLSVEKGFFLAIATRDLEESCGNTELQSKIWKLAFYIKVLHIKIQNEFSQL